MKINFITTESIDNFSGGWSGNSYNLYKALQSKGEVLHYIGPVKPPITKWEKYYSRVLRFFGFKSKFYYFSFNRLHKIQKIIESKIDGSVDYTFFMGSTHWLNFTPHNSYGAFLDANFRTYFDNNLKTNQFQKKDIARIENLEKRWLENATHIFWASEWAKNEALKQYDLKNNNHYVVGIGGNLFVPGNTNYKGDIHFLFMAQDFYLKGGDLAFEAFKNVYAKHPHTKLYILGQQPPAIVLDHPGIVYPGYLKKNIPEELNQFTNILSESFCLIHPTKSDTIAQVIIECGYFGCPSIAPARFAIPEIIKHNETGILLKPVFTSKDIEEAMLLLIENPKLYSTMRLNVRERFISTFTYEAVCNKILGEINQ